MAKAKAKKRKGTKIRDLKPRKTGTGQVKGGVHLSEDPCAGGKLR